MSTTGENKKEQELQPCPRCGKRPIFVCYYGTGTERTSPLYRCPSYNCQYAMTLEWWNKRAASEADSVSRTKPAESASVIPQSHVLVDLESEWTVSDGETCEVLDGIGKPVPLMQNLARPVATSYCDTVNASLRQLRETLIQEVSKKRHGASGLCCQLRLQAVVDLAALREQKEEAERKLADQIEVNVRLVQEWSASRSQLKTAREALEKDAIALKMARTAKQ